MKIWNNIIVLLLEGYMAQGYREGHVRHKTSRGQDDDSEFLEYVPRNIPSQCKWSSFWHHWKDGGLKSIGWKYYFSVDAVLWHSLDELLAFILPTSSYPLQLNAKYSTVYMNSLLEEKLRNSHHQNTCCFSCLMVTCDIQAIRIASYDTHNFTILRVPCYIGGETIVLLLKDNMNLKAFTKREERQQYCCSWLYMRTGTKCIWTFLTINIGHDSTSFKINGLGHNKYVSTVL